MTQFDRPSLLSRALRPFLAIACGAIGLGALATPADAVTVTLKDGASIEADSVYYTYTDLVVVTRENDMRLIPNSRVQSVDGHAFAQAYWGDQPGEPDSTVQPPLASAAPASGTTGPNALWPIMPGTVRRYALTQARTTWVRHGRVMDRRGTEAATGTVVETVTSGGASAPGGLVIMTEAVRAQAAGGTTPPDDTALTHVIQPRGDGYYLLAQAIETPGLRQPHQEDRIDVPPRLWPDTLNIGQSWTVGPFKRLGLSQAGRMEVVGRESVTVPSGTYPDAFRVVGRSNVYAGTQLLKEGRLVTENGTIDSTTWFVPGLGPVKEETKVHLHQDYFPAKPQSAEIPLVVEETSTRTLSEFQLGK